MFSTPSTCMVPTPCSLSCAASSQCTNISEMMKLLFCAYVLDLSSKAELGQAQQLLRTFDPPAVALDTALHRRLKPVQGPAREELKGSERICAWLWCVEYESEPTSMQRIFVGWHLWSAAAGKPCIPNPFRFLDGLWRKLAASLC